MSLGKNRIERKRRFEEKESERSAWEASRGRTAVRRSLWAAAGGGGRGGVATLMKARLVSIMYTHPSIPEQIHVGRTSFQLRCYRHNKPSGCERIMPPRASCSWRRTHAHKQKKKKKNMVGCYCAKQEKKKNMN